MSAHRTASPNARIVARTPVHPGEVAFYCENVEGLEAVCGLATRCPCGCGAERFFWFGAADEPDWGFNYDLARPSMAKEVGFPNCPHAWRGRLTHGRWLPRGTRRG